MDDLLLNQSVHAHRTFFHGSWRADCNSKREPADIQNSIASRFALPAEATIERIFRDELSGLGRLFDVWSRRAGLDIRQLYFRNTTAKRALYISPIMFLPDTLGDKEFRREGSNSRIHVFHAHQPENSIRLEAITTTNHMGKRFRYALSIQYERDATGQPWQLLRPVILVDEAVLREVQAFDDSTRQTPGILDFLQTIIAQGMHDYVHGAVLRWFPPPALSMPHAYVSKVFEQPPPSGLKEWHRAANRSWPPGFGDETFAADIEPLELYSLLVHADNAAAIFAAEPAVKARMIELATRYFEILNEFSAWRSTRVDGRSLVSFDRYLSLIAAWFLAGVFPVGGRELTSLLEEPDWCGIVRTDVLSYFGEIHGGYFSYINRVDRNVFTWGDAPIALETVTKQYAAGLVDKAIDAHITSLLGARGRSGGYLRYIAQSNPHLAALARTAEDRLGASIASHRHVFEHETNELGSSLRSLSQALRNRQPGDDPEAAAAGVTADYLDSLADYIHSLSSERMRAAACS